MESPGLNTASCELRATATLITPALLRLHYQVRNHSEQPFFLFNRFFLYVRQQPGLVEAMPNMANVQLGSDRVTVGKALVPVPDDMEVERRYIPCLSRVTPRGMYEETFELPVPLVPFTVYKHRPLTKGPVPRPLYFELGYFVASEYTESLITAVATTHGEAYYIDSYPMEEQMIATTGILLPEVTVLSNR